MVCFLTFGTYVGLQPYEDEADDTIAMVAQIQIFFTLLSAIALTFQTLAPQETTNLDALLIVFLAIPFVCAFLLNTPAHKLFQSEERRKLWNKLTRSGKAQPKISVSSAASAKV